MRGKILCGYFAVTVALLSLFGCSELPTPSDPARPLAADSTVGTLRVDAVNPRYFADRAGRIVYLAGAHTWRNLQDAVSSEHAGTPFDYSGYIQFLERI